MDLSTVIERLENLKEQNTKDHQGICDRLDYTNGSVKRLSLWRAKTEGFLKGVKLLYIFVGGTVGFAIQEIIKLLQNAN